MKVHRARRWVMFSAALSIAFAARSARADVMAISPAAFPPGSTLITFAGQTIGTDVNNLSVGGVQFSYSLGNGHLFISNGPTAANNVSLLAIVSEGTSTGILTLLLPGSQTLFGFGFALASFVPALNATTITLFNGATNVGALSYNAVPDPNFVGGFAGIQSTVAFDRVQLTFNSGQQFALDNIQFANVTTVTPEPATLALVLTGLIGIASVRRRRFHSETD